MCSELYDICNEYIHSLKDELILNNINVNSCWMCISYTAVGTIKCNYSGIQYTMGIWFSPTCNYNYAFIGCGTVLYPNRRIDLHIADPDCISKLIKFIKQENYVET